MRLLALVLLSLVTLAAPARADETIAELARPASVDAYGGRIAYSAYDPQARVWRLMVERGDGSPRTVPVAPRQSRFDVDLGPGPRGTTVAVYSRCAGRRGCEVHLYDFETQRERRLRGPSTRADEVEPSVWRRRIAFLRVGRGRPELHVTRLDGGPGRKVPTSPRRLGTRGTAHAPELSGRQLAYVWANRGGNRFQMRLKTLGRRQIVVDEAESGESFADVLQPTFARGALFFASVRRGLAGSSGRFARYDVRTGRRRTAKGPLGMLRAAYDAKGRRFAYVQTRYEDDNGAVACLVDYDEPAPCALRRTDRIAFRR